MSSSEVGKSPFRKILSIISIVALIVLLFCFLKVGIVSYGEPINQTRMVWKPSPGKVFYRLQFPEGTSEGQLASLRDTNLFYLDFPYVLDNTILTSGDDGGAFGRVVVMCYPRNPAGNR